MLIESDKFQLKEHFYWTIMKKAYRINNIWPVRSSELSILAVIFFRRWNNSGSCKTCKLDQEEGTVSQTYANLLWYIDQILVAIPETCPSCFWWIDIFLQRSLFFTMAPVSNHCCWENTNNQFVSFLFLKWKKVQRQPKCLSRTPQCCGTDSGPYVSEKKPHCWTELFRYQHLMRIFL